MSLFYDTYTVVEPEASFRARVGGLLVRGGGRCLFSWIERCGSFAFHCLETSSPSRYAWDIGMPSGVYSVSVAFGAPTHPTHQHVTAGVDLRAALGLGQGVGHWAAGRLAR